MLKGLIKVYTFTIESDKDTEELTDILDDIYYKKHSPRNCFTLQEKKGKL